MKFTGFMEAVTLTNLYRGMAGEYKPGRNDIQHFAGDIPTAVHYAKKEASRPENRGLRPMVYMIRVPSQTLSNYRTVGGTEEIYDIPANIVDRFNPQAVPIEQAEKMASNYQNNLEISGNKTVPMIFQGQGPDNNGWSVKLSAMGKPQDINRVIVKDIRDMTPDSVKHPALLQRMERLKEEPVLILSPSGVFVTTMPPASKQVLNKQIKQPAYGRGAL
jgi:hypothetical protein